MSADSVTYVGAFGAGLISFVSPCVLPIVPGYLSVITGLDLADAQHDSGHHLGRVARDTGMFIAGFTVVFILLGVTATAIGSTVFHNHLLLTRISGLMVLAMALFLAGSLVLRSPWLYQERRFHPDTSRFGVFAAPVAGAAFGFGWTPCLGPVLGSILALAGTQGRAVEGGALLAAYSAGLGVPFLATGLAFGRMARAFGWVKRHFVAITLVSSISLAFFGVLLTLNRLTWMTSEIRQGMSAIGLDSLVNLG